MQAAPIAAPPADFNVDPGDLMRVIAKLLAAWPGEKRPDAPYVSGFNTGGSKPPVFWISQSHGEIIALAALLPPDQPFYAMKSVYLGLMGFHPQELLHFIGSPYIDVVSEAFQRDIARVSGDRPYVLAGHCTGAVTTLDIALRAQPAPGALVLMNYPLVPKPYAGRCEMLFGAAEWAAFNADPQHLAGFAQARVTVMDGPHSSYFFTGAIKDIFAALQRAVADIA